MKFPVTTTERHEGKVLAMNVDEEMLTLPRFIVRQESCSGLSHGARSSNGCLSATTMPGFPKSARNRELRLP